VKKNDTFQTHAIVAKQTVANNTLSKHVLLKSYRKSTAHHEWNPSKYKGR